MMCKRSAGALGLLVVACLALGCAGSGDSPTGNNTGGGGGGKKCKPPAGGATISFSQTVQPIFDRSCAFAPACHAGPVPAGPGYDLSPGKSCAASVNVPSREVPSLKLVKPGDPNSSYMVLKIQGAPNIAQQQMPQGCPGTPLDARSQCLTADQIAAIVQWVTECAPCDN
jgi:hypothetical protein